MYCLKCGRKISDAAEFCPYCGADQYPASDLVENRYTEDTRYSQQKYSDYEDTRYSQPKYSDYEDTRYSQHDYNDPYDDRAFEEPQSRKPKTQKTTVTKTTYKKKTRKHSPAGIILVALLTVGAFFLVVFGSKSIIPKISEMTHKISDSISKSNSDETPDETPTETPAETPVEEESMAGSYSAVSAVYDGKKLNSMMLKLSGTKISLDVYEDGTFTAAINSDIYSGEWYRNGDYVEFYADNLSMTGSYSDDTLSLSEDSQGISVVLKK